MSIGFYIGARRYLQHLACPWRRISRTLVLGSSYMKESLYVPLHDTKKV